MFVFRVLLALSSFFCSNHGWSYSFKNIDLRLEGHTDTITRAFFSIDGQKIVTASMDKNIRVYNAQDGQLLLTIQLHKKSFNDVCFDATGQYLLAMFDKTTYKYDLKDGSVIEKSCTEKCPRYALSLDKRRKLKFDKKNRIRVKNAINNKLKFVITPRKMLTFATFGSQNEVIIIAADGSVDLWDKNGRFIRPLAAKDQHINSIDISVKQNLLLVVSHQKIVRLRHLVPASLGNEAAINELPTNAKYSILWLKKFMADNNNYPIKNYYYFIDFITKNIEEEQQPSTITGFSELSLPCHMYLDALLSKNLHQRAIHDF